MIIKCEICGKEFEGYQRSRYCSDECRIVVRRQNDRERVARRKYINKQTKVENHTVSISDIEKLARQAGMSYGQYVAKVNANHQISH